MVNEYRLNIFCVLMQVEHYSSKQRGCVFVVVERVAQGKVASMVRRIPGPGAFDLAITRRLAREGNFIHRALFKSIGRCSGYEITPTDLLTKDTSIGLK